MVVEKWLSSFNSKSTRNVYSSGLKMFVKTVVGDGDFDRNIQQYLSQLKEGRDLFKDLLTYASSLAQRPPKTAKVYMTSVMSFLEYELDFELSKKQKKQLRAKLPKGKIYVLRNMIYLPYLEQTEVKDERKVCGGLSV